MVRRPRRRRRFRLSVRPFILVSAIAIAALLYLNFLCLFRDTDAGVSVQEDVALPALYNAGAETPAISGVVRGKVTDTVAEILFKYDIVDNEARVLQLGKRTQRNLLKLNSTTKAKIEDKSKKKANATAVAVKEEIKADDAVAANPVPGKKHDPVPNSKPDLNPDPVPDNASDPTPGNKTDRAPDNKPDPIPVEKTNPIPDKKPNPTPASKTDRTLDKPKHENNAAHVTIREDVRLPTTGATEKVEEDSTATGDLSSKRHNLTIHFYGGSITAGYHAGGGNRFSNKIQRMLQEFDHNVKVATTNFGIPAADPSFWTECGFESADIIISEYRLNSDHKPTLKTWYERAMKKSKHLVVLDLWSWLTPPGDPKSTSATISAIPTRSTSTSVSVVSLDKIEHDAWQELVPIYFNRTGYKPSIPQECYDALYMRSKIEIIQMEKCRREHANLMQHGNAVYHENIAKMVYNHLVPNVITRILREEDDLIDGATTPSTTMCFSEWNLRPGTKYSNVKPWDMTMIKNEGFSLNNATSNTFKITLNANSTSAQLQLHCPSPFNTAAKIGYIVHSNPQESGIFLLNGAPVSTKLRGDTRPNIRVRKYSSLSTLPMNLSIKKLPMGQNIEFTGLICSGKG